MSTTRRSSDCPRCLKRVRLVGARGLMPRHLDPSTRKRCESSGDRPTDAAAHVRHEAQQEEARRAAITRWQVEQVVAPTPVRRDIHDQHGCEGCSVCEPWTETHAEIASIRDDVLSARASMFHPSGHERAIAAMKLDAVAERLAALLPPTEDAAQEVDDAIDLGHSN
jgi:hypothetical protein